MKRCNCHPPKPPEPIPDPVQHTGSSLYPDVGPRPFTPYTPMPPRPPVPKPEPEPAPKPCPCPPRVYRNPPDVEIVAGRNIDLQVDKGDTVWKYTVSSEADKINVLPGDHIAVQRETTDDGTDFTIDAVQFPVKIDGDSADVLYGDGTPENPLGVYDFAGATAQYDGKPGTVPAPAISEREYYLRGDGTWSPIVIPEQVQSDWAEESELSPAFIRNKPDIDAKIAVETNRAEKAEAAATTEVKAGEYATVTEETAADGHKIYTVNADGKPQVQADWAQEDDTKVDYIKNRPDIEAMIDAAVSTERDRATEAEETLHTEIDAETERATGAEETLHTEIVTETARAIAGEAELSSAISSETTRATDAEAALGNRITAETTRAEGIETTLSDKIANRYTKTETDTALAAKQDKPSSSTEGDIATFDSGSSTVDSGKTFLNSTDAWDGTSDSLVPTAKSIQTKLDEKYTRPVSGIPSEDLDSTVNASLDKADSAVQGVKLAGAETPITPDAGNIVTIPTFSGDAPGLVPSAEASDAAKALRGDGTWGDVSSVSVSYDLDNEELHLDFSAGGN